MKIILAPDKYKGSLTGIEFCNIVEQGIKSVIPDAEIIKMPLADGGDGTIEILDYHLKAKQVKIKVNDPLFRPIEVSYLYLESSQIAIIEMAESSGMKLLNVEEQNCFFTTSFGIGEVIQDAINRGAKNIVLGIGGSATNDCGIWMACALGYKFEDKNGNEVVPIGMNLSKIEKIDISNVNKSLKTVKFKVACDVNNPLYGTDGAAYVYAPQKGASPKQVKILNHGLKHFLDDINEKNIDSTLKNLNRSLLVLHSPQDTTVGIENAAQIYQCARHPKSFISLDGADHLLSNKEDSLYVGKMIAIWSERYIKK